FEGGAASVRGLAVMEPDHRVLAAVQGNLAPDRVDLLTDDDLVRLTVAAHRVVAFATNLRAMVAGALVDRWADDDSTGDGGAAGDMDVGADDAGEAALRARYAAVAARARARWRRRDGRGAAPGG